MILRLGLSSLLFEKLINICLIASMCSVIAPLLLLFSLRFGIISNLEDNLKANPVNLEIRMLSGYRLGEDFFKSMRENPKISFVLPLTRTLSATVNLNHNGKMITSVEAVPTDRGDPLALKSGLDGVLKEREAYLSEQVAEDLKLKVGDSFKFIVSRITDSSRVNSVVEFTLKGIIKKEYLPYKSVMVNFDTLVYMEDYKDGFEPPLFSDNSRANDKREYFSKARIYVKELDDVKDISALLRQNYSISDKLAAIENLKAISNVLSFIFITIASTSIVGGILATGGLILTNVSRQLKSFAYLMLTGLSRMDIFKIVMLESLILSVLAFMLSYLIFSLGMFTFNLYFKDLLGENTLVSTLTLTHVITGFILCSSLSLTVTALIIRLRIYRLEIVDVLRQV